MIIKAYGEFDNKSYSLDNGIACETKIFDNIEFGYNKIVIETPEVDEDGNIVRKGKKIVVDTKKRDTENVPLDQDIECYFEKEVKPYNEIAFIDKNKTKVGYEIPFMRYFYRYIQPENLVNIENRISNLENNIMSSLKVLFTKDGGYNE